MITVTTIATILGVEWQGSEHAGDYTIGSHAERQSRLKGFEVDDVLRAANSPGYSYPNGRFPGQRRHIREGIVAVVDVQSRVIVTVYVDHDTTPLREDQTDRDALNFAARARK